MICDICHLKLLPQTEILAMLLPLFRNKLYKQYYFQNDKDKYGKASSMSDAFLTLNSFHPPNVFNP